MKGCEWMQGMELGWGICEWGGRGRVDGGGGEDNTDYFFNPPRAGRADAPQPALAPQLSHRGSQPLLRSCLTGAASGGGICEWGGKKLWYSRSGSLVHFGTEYQSVPIWYSLVRLVQCTKV